MSKPLSASELQSLIEKSITSYKSFLDTLTSDPSNMSALKKASLISYWMFDYLRMLRNEDAFDSSKLLKYRRGDVLSVNFGYRLGSELGG